MAFLDSISNIAGAASNKVGQLSTIAKGALCIPSIISGLSIDGIKKLAGGVAGSISSAIQDSISAVTDLALGAVQDQVNKLTGAINGLISTATGLVATIAGTIETAVQFYKDTKAQILDIKDFIDTKENCQFAAAALANCIISESINNLSLKAVKDISTGLGSIDGKVSELSNKISEPTGAINNFMDKGSKQLDKAASVISAAKLI